MASGCAKDGRNGQARLVLTLWDITAEGTWAILRTIEPNN
jgi:hypothetical protein